jgi:hypothetical protein
MKAFRFKPMTVLAAALAATFMVGCTSTGTTGSSGNVRGGGWENFRAEAPPLEQGPAPVA